MIDSHPIKFLLVDDLDANLVALEALLEREGLELLKASSGQEALEILLVHDVALAFVDVQMPLMSGFELAEIMRSTERTRRTPIIFLTAGNVDQEHRIRGYETGAVDFLPKPIDPTILRNKAAVFYELAVHRVSLQEREHQLQESNEKLAWSNAELANADKKKDEFLAMLAHELRNPLAPLLTGIEILVASPEGSARLDEIAGMMKRQIGQMAHLIDDLLDVSRINHGKIELRKTRISLAAVLDQAVEAVQPLISANQHDLVIEKPDPSLTLDGDHHRLIQVVSNLLSNAAKYTPAGGKIVLSTTVSDDQSVRICVEDNGRGISAEHLVRIFDLFDQGAAGPQDGLGIGLTLVKSLVEMHGGQITATSAGQGMGSQFAVVLPGLGENPEQPSGQMTAPEGSRESRRVLVADDGKSTADILGMFFEIEGMDCRVVYDGRLALEEAGRFLPHLVCLDIGMPVMNGYEAAREIRKTCPDAYIVALSGWGSIEDRKKSSDAGFDEHLVKPVSPQDLRKLMARLPTSK